MIYVKLLEKIFNFKFVKNKRIFLVAMLFIVIIVIALIYFNHDAISDRLGREYRNCFSRQPRQMFIEQYAGCQARTMVEKMSDEDFSKQWLEDSKQHNFDEKDVDEWMQSRCPIASDNEIIEGFEKYNKATNYKYCDKDDNEKSIEKAKEMRDYKLKFKNREFSIFKNRK